MRRGENRARVGGRKNVGEGVDTGIDVSCELHRGVVIITPGCNVVFWAAKSLQRADRVVLCADTALRDRNLKLNAFGRFKHGRWRRVQDII